MDPDRVIDLYFDIEAPKVWIIRRTDYRCWKAAKLNRKMIGKAIRAALVDLSEEHDQEWITVDDDSGAYSDKNYVVVVYRDNHEMVVATPIYDWGTLPTVRLNDPVSDGFVGGSILDHVHQMKIASQSGIT